MMTTRTLCNLARKIIVSINVLAAVHAVKLGHSLK
jgi:hypothetical protein